MDEITTASAPVEIEKKNFFQRLKEKFHTSSTTKKISLAILLVAVLFTPIIIAQQTNFFSHAGISLLTNCTPIPTGLTQQQIQALDGKVNWCGGKASILGASSFQLLSSFKGIGNIENSLVGPGATSTTQKFYLTYVYGEISDSQYPTPFDLVGVDPANNYKATVYSSPVTSEKGAWALTVGPDNNLYVGTLPNAHVMRFNPQTTQYTDFGQVPADPKTNKPQEYIWNLTVSPYDQRIYGCTYPSGDLISFKPTDTTPQVINLGPLDSTGKNQSGRYCVADPNPNNPYVYIGLGTVSEQIVAYNILTKAITTLASQPISGTGAYVFSGIDGAVYGRVGTQFYSLSNGAATAVSTNSPTNYRNTFSNGDKISIAQQTVTITHSDNTTNTYPYTYQGEPMTLYRVVAGTDGNIYTASILPFYFGKFDPKNPSNGITNLGNWGGGEPYNMVSLNNHVYIAGYYLAALNGNSALQDYNTTLPINPNPYKPTCGATGNNPQCVAGMPNDLRPFALTPAQNGNLYVGSVGRYGELSGYLIAWTPQSNSQTTYRPFSNLGVSSLTVANNCAGVISPTYCIVGGTTVNGGTGTTPTASNAPLFTWNPSTNTIVNRYAIPNVPNTVTITDLITSPKNNYVYGIAINSQGSYFFIFNPTTGTFINKGTLLDASFGNFFWDQFNSVAIGSDGNIWGISSKGIFEINVTTNTMQFIAAAPAQINTGFGFTKDPKNGDRIYYASGDKLYMYSVPMPVNLVKNPSFESGLTYWNTKINTTYDGGSTSLDTTYHNDGAYSFLANVTAANTSVSWYSFEAYQSGFPLTAGAKYTVSFWAKGDGVHRLLLRVRSSSTSNIYFDLAPSSAIIPTVAGRIYSYTFTPTVNDSSASVIFGFGGNKGKVWIDSVSITKI